MPEISKGDVVYVKAITRGLTKISRAKVKDVVGQGCIVKIDNDPTKTRMVSWPKLGVGKKGPWGKKALTNGRKKGKKKRRLTMSSLEIKEAPRVSPAAKTSLRAVEKLASDLVGNVVKLDEKDGAYIVITPELATRWLDKSQGKNRRRLTDRYVDKYQKTMEDDLWSPRTAAPIQVDEEGDMINGQHRFWAVALSGRAVEMYVVFGVTRDEEKHGTDTGITRNAAVSLGISNRYVAIINAIRRHSTGNRVRDAATNNEIDQIYQHYKEPIEWFANIPGTTEGKKVTRPSDIVGVVIRAKSLGENEDILTAFVQALRRDAFSPGLEEICSAERIVMVNKLAQYLQSTKASSDPSRNERTSKVEWVLRRFLRDEPFKKIVANQEKLWACPLVVGN